MSFKERWTKKFAESLTKNEKKAFRLARLFRGKRRVHLGLFFTFNYIGVLIRPFQWATRER